MVSVNSGSSPDTKIGHEIDYYIRDLRGEVVRKSVQHMLEDILRDYPKLPSYIKQREDELKYPTPEQDDNVGGGRALNKLSDPVGREVITINDDRWLQQLKKERQAIDECLDESGVVTEKIIQETYFKGNVGLRMVDLCDRQIITVSTTKAYELRNSFLVELGKKLNVDVM